MFAAAEDSRPPNFLLLHLDWIEAAGAALYGDRRLQRLAAAI